MIIKSLKIFQVILAILLISLASAGQGSFHISDKLSPSRDYFSINGTTGNIGIGVNNAIPSIHVNSSGSTIGFIIESNSSQSGSLSPRLGLIDIFTNPVSSALIWHVDNNRTDFRIFRKPNITASTSTESVALFIESTNNYIGIGTSTPQSLLDVSGDLNVTGAVYGNILPSRMISAFYLDACPTGWVLADGTNEAPNLIGRFILGGTTNGTTGGTTALNTTHLPSHTHTVDFASVSTGTPTVSTTSGTTPTTSSTSFHYHDTTAFTTRATLFGTSATVGFGIDHDSTVSSGGSSGSGGAAHTHPINSHTHSMEDHFHTYTHAPVISSTNGSSTTYYQPYYTLIFCMKV